ncbi:MAG TPA: hypothetical protein VM580_05100, partial [Labilithrix sp.]|nr:hypothetical protein [Labilithrix sp.]
MARFSSEAPSLPKRRDARGAGFALVLVAALSACGGAHTRVNTPRGLANMSAPLVAAFREEAVGDPVKAVELYTRALSEAGASPDDPSSVAIAMASLDALVHHDVAAFAETASSSALADRIDPTLLKKNGGTIDDRLAKVAKDAEGPFVPGLIANARLALAERRGDAKTAAEMRATTGCAREAALLGPVAWMTVSSVREPALLDKPNTPMPSEVAGPGPFTTKLTPLKVAAFGCRLPLYAQTSAPGVREIAVDVDVSKAGWIGVGLRTSSAAVLRAGSKIAIDRPHELGGNAVPRYARVESTPGTLRLVARVGMDQDFESVEIGAWDADGKPLRTHAPAPGATAGATVKQIVAVAPSEPRTDPERVAVALGALAANDVRLAENLLSPQVARTDAPPELSLVYARAVRKARDLPNVKAQERARAMYDRILETWPASWEAAIEHAVLAGARRGRAEAYIETLADHDATRQKTQAAQPALVDAFEAAVAGREQLYDRAHGAFERIKGPLAGTSLLADIDRVVFERTGRELVAFDCSDKAADRTSLACHHALVATGDREGAEKELERLRALAGTPQLYLSLSSRSAIEVGDAARTDKLLSLMNPGDRALSSIYAAKGKTAVPELLRLATTTRDAPAALPALLRDAGDDPLARFDGIADKVVGDPSVGPLLANAATAILAHRERYDIEPTGLVHFTLLDVRRVMGTTDVEANAQAAAPTLFGRATVRVLRRRIFKKDGRVVLPDRTPNAAQSHADLSQLEAGDAVEAIYEGWGVPNETGNVGIDTPDLLPERTAVHQASIELAFPAGLRNSMWSHPLLGKAEERTEPSAMG